MSSEIRVQTSIQIKKGSQLYQSQPTSFIADWAGTARQTPGGFLASIAGTNVDLSHLNTMGGFFWIQNCDTKNSVTWGIWDSVSSTFYPAGKILPGEFYLGRLPDELGHDEVGTGSALVGTTYLRVKARLAPCQVIVEAFDA